MADEQAESPRSHKRQTKASEIGPEDISHYLGSDLALDRVNDWLPRILAAMEGVTDIQVAQEAGRQVSATFTYDGVMVRAHFSSTHQSLLGQLEAEMSGSRLNGLKLLIRERLRPKLRPSGLM